MGSLVYFPFVYALERQSGWTPMRRFACTITHISSGYFPNSRFVQAGIDRMRQPWNEAAIEQLIRDWTVSSINPFSQVFRSIASPHAMIAGLNAYNALGVLASRTKFAMKPGGDGDFVWHTHRSLIQPEHDLKICASITLAGYDTLRQRLCYRNKTSKPAHQTVTRISDMARYFGTAHSASCQVAQVCETLGHVSLAEIAANVGCHPRTLERRLREEGTTAEMIRQGARLIRATDMLRSDQSLTMIALDAGFCDLAHMDRAFRLACGGPPSFLRGVLAHDQAERRRQHEPQALAQPARGSV